MTHVVRWLLLSCGLVFVFASLVQADRGYTVRSGDTLTRIARRFRVSVDEIKRKNRLRSDRVREGMRLRIPSRGDRRGAYRAGYHVVRSGETLSRIARRYRVPLAAFRRLNRIDGDRLREGQRLRIPGRRAENPLPRVQARPLRSDQEVARLHAERLGLGDVRVGQRLLVEAPEPAWVEAASQAPLEIVTSEEESEDVERVSVEAAEDGHDDEPEPGTLGLPIDTAYYMRGWGSGAGGYHLAVDIGSPPGTPIRAAERGIVAYVGHGIRGYGRFVMIIHPSGFITAYAHNRETLVVAGELVRRGQIIARLGNTGLSRGPHLHFMLLHQGQHCDPLPLFRPLIRYRTGGEVTTKIANWSQGRPSEVRCLSRQSRRHPGVRWPPRRRRR